ncbi:MULTISPECIES: YigZ family protein [Eikenella]|uniref:YigZ family protein n=1 Tax=Eikenella longinqua TaxID=1795827 RepID=A0A1A9RXG3_9NEIS|nr:MULTISPECIES: YigZ family protein [Eikenella]OAM29101.1 YigZ family protein [Eikenella longinqua]
MTSPAVYTYRTLAEPGQAEFKDKGSRFIAFAYPVRTVAEVKNHVDALRQEHHKARHWCYAYRLGTDGLQFRANDDGEPSGSAGRPILGQIDSAELTDVLVVVVRYFGGTLLGVPGLIHAYKTATQLVLQQTGQVEKNIEKQVLLRCDYPHLSEVLRLGKQHGAEVLQQDLQLDCRLHFAVPLAGFATCMEAWLDTRAVEILDEPPPGNEEAT